MLTFEEQFELVEFIQARLNRMLEDDRRYLSTETAFADLQGTRQMIDALYQLHARAEHTKAYHITLEAARDCLTSFHAELAQEIRTEFEQKNNLLYRKIFG